MEIGQGISHRGLEIEEFHIAFYISGTVTADDVGKPVAIDATAARTVKLAADNDLLVGKLVAYEERVVEGVNVATVALKGGFGFTASSGASIDVGDTVIGAGNGEVKEAATNVPSHNIVTSVSGTAVEVLFL